jgi:predicted nucleic acid-binding protein
MQQTVYNALEEILSRLSNHNKIFIDDLRKDLGIGYASDTNVHLYILGFEPNKNREKLLKWFKNTSQVIYFTQLYEIVSVLNRKKEELEIKELEVKEYSAQRKRIEMIENKLIKLLDSPKVRLVLNEKYDLKSLDPVLYETLFNQFGELSNDMKIASSSSYEKVPLLSYDMEFGMILFKYNLPYIDPYKPLPYEYTKEWRELLNEKKKIT